MNSQENQTVTGQENIPENISGAGVNPMPAAPQPMDDIPPTRPLGGDAPQQQAGMPQQQAGMPPQQAGMPQQQPGMAPSQQPGMPSQQAGMPPQQAGVPQPQQAGMPPQQAGMAPQQQPGMAPPQAGMPQPQQPGMPPQRPGVPPQVGMPPQAGMTPQAYMGNTAAYQQQQKSNKAKLGILVGLIVAVLGAIVGILIWKKDDIFGKKKSDDTVVATGDPTGEPTPGPTDGPTAEPTQEPTPEPTAEPTQEPTPEPTPEPQYLAGLTVDFNANIADLKKAGEEKAIPNKVGYCGDDYLILCNRQWKDNELFWVDPSGSGASFLLAEGNIQFFTVIGNEVYYSLWDDDEGAGTFWKKGIWPDSEPERTLGYAYGWMLLNYRDKIYFDDWDEDYHLYCYDPQTGKSTLIGDDEFGQYDIVNDHIYYENLDNGMMYRIGLDGSGKQELFSLEDYTYGEDSLSNFIAFEIEEQVFFAFTTSNGETYITTEDGGERQLVVSGLYEYDAKQRIYYDNGSLYYSAQESTELHKLDIREYLTTDVEELRDKVIFEDDFGAFEVLDGIVYVVMYSGDKELRILDASNGREKGIVSYEGGSGSGTETDGGESFAVEGDFKTVRSETIRGNGMGFSFENENGNWLLLKTNKGIAAIYRYGDTYVFDFWSASLNDDIEIKSVAAYGDYAYLACGEYGIARMDFVNGGAIYRITEGNTTSFAIAGNKLFYIVLEDTYNSYGDLYMADLDGKNPKLIYEDVSCCFMREGSADMEYVDGYLYFMDAETYTLCRIKPGQTKAEAVWGAQGIDGFTHREGLYYNNGKFYFSGDRDIYTYDPVTEEAEVIKVGRISKFLPLVFAGDSLFYMDSDWIWHQIYDGESRVYDDAANDSTLYLDTVGGQLVAFENYSEYYTIEINRGRITSKNQVDLDYYATPDL